MRELRPICLCIVLSAACAQAPALRRTSHGHYQADHLEYSIAPLPDGALMPAGWTLQNYQEKDGTLRKSDGKDVRDLSFSRTSDDGFVFIASKPISTMGKRTLASLLHDFIDSHLDAQKRTMETEVSAGAPRAIAGGEGFAVTVEIRNSARDAAPLSRVYYLCFWPASRDEMSVLVYANTMPAFDRSLAQVNELVERISYQ